jgi:beta-glucosidase
MAITVILCFAWCVGSVRAKIMWGTATAAYQVEGYRDADGRQPSIWDAFDTPNISSVIKSVKPNGASNIYHGENAAVADGDYVKYPDSVRLVKEYGYGAARLSISWSRVMTYTKDEKSGGLKWTRNEEGIRHYRSVLAEYKANGIQTALTIFHWDLPLAIEELAASKPCGSAWLCHDLITDFFAEYADLLFTEYGNQRDAHGSQLVDWWITINEPLTITSVGYAGPGHAPGRCSDRTLCYAGDEHTEPYAVIKGMVLAHARAFRLWEQKHNRTGSGCGITLNGDWRIPLTSSEADRAAAQRSLEWQAPPFADPLFFGKWPDAMVERVGSRLPAWTDEEVKLVKGAHDGNFFMNSYTTNFAREAQTPNDCGWNCDAGVDTSGYNWTSHAPVGTPSSNGWLFNYGPGLGELVNWYHERYGPDVSFLITENGWGNASSTMEAEMEADDHERCIYYRDYIGNLSAIATHNKINVVAYFAWSLMDNYEWADGFSVRFGLTFVNYTTGQRTPKMSARWFQKHVTPLAELPNDGRPLPPCDRSLLAETVVV